MGFSKTAVLSSLVFAVAVTASAAVDGMIPIERPDGAPTTVKEAVLRYNAAHPSTRIAAAGAKRSRRAIKPNVIEVETADFAFIIPAAGNVAGANGTFFKSDFSIGNFANAAQTVGIGWLAAGADNSTAALQYFVIPANSVSSFSDFVGQSLGKSGLGAILVISYNDAKTSVDDTGLIDGFSRIWTPEAGRPAGTNSQSFPAVSIQDSEANFTAYALGLRQDGNFRTNVGVVNLDTVQHTWTIQAYTGASTQLTVPPVSLGQTGAPTGSANSSGYVALTFTPTDSADFFWSAYASSTDNVTGDGWVSRATQ